MKKRFACALILPLVTVCMTACTSNSSEDLAKLEKRVQILEQETKELKLQVAQAQPAASTVAVNTKTEPASPAGLLPADASVVATDTADGASSGAKSFADIQGVFGENEIKDLVKLGVFPEMSANFNPSEPVKRAEFVCWLVRANNAIRPKKDLIRLAEKGSTSSFTDLEPSQKYFAYIQGMSDAGWSVGYPDKTFKADKALTREEMIGIKIPLDHGNNPFTGYTKKWTDGDKISANFVDSMSDEAFGNVNWGRIFGNTKSCNPQKTVTRAEAAICVWQIGWHHKYQASKPEADS